MRNLFPPDLNPNSTDLDFLAQLQHQGAATGLIDFTLKSLVALWFACRESRETDGAVFVLPLSHTKEIINTRTLKLQIAHFFKDNTLWSWEPTPLGSRIEAQGSVFVFGGTEIPVSIMNKFVVKANCKQEILAQLETQHHIHEEILNPDFPGYAEANASNKPFDIQRSVLYWEEQVELAQNDNQLSLAFYNCGVACGAVNDLAKAIEYFDKAIERNPHYVSAYYNRGHAKSELNQHEEAIVDYDKALCIAPNDSRVYSSRGDSKAKLGLLEEAMKDHDKALEIFPNDANAYNNRGLVNLGLGKLFDAIADFIAAIQIDPDFELAYVNRSSARAALGKHEEAILDCNAAIRINPESVKAYVNRGGSKLHLKQYKGAVADFDTAICINPKFTIAYYNRGNAWLALNLREKAINDYTTALSRPRVCNGLLPARNH